MSLVSLLDCFDALVCFDGGGWYGPLNGIGYGHCDTHNHISSSPPSGDHPQAAALGAVRTVDEAWAPDGSTTGFADAFPLLLSSTASLEDLNTKAGGDGSNPSVPMDRFRSNVIVQGGTAWDEDTWKTVHIGNVAFQVAKPCGRCTVRWDWYDDDGCTTSSTTPSVSPI